MLTLTNSIFRFLFIYFTLYSPVNAGRYWGNHCGREANNRFAPAVDAFDAACYRHDRCQESGVPDWICSMQVGMGMMQASAQTGQPVPMQILTGFGQEHGKRRKRLSVNEAIFLK
uniref:Phospholipase A(2) n=1 Tax=Ditylenchus dipsaci TaxID=166011 RepID=A0A915DQQ8_9BILA